MGYSGKVFSAFSWQTALKLALIVVSFGRIFFLARLLTPDDFGLYAIVMIALGLLESTTETGINVTIIQATEKIEYFLDTAWVIAIFRGGVISALMLVASVVIAYFYHQPTLIPLICFTAVIPLIKGFINPVAGALQKDFRFATQVLIQFSRFVIEAILAVAFVFLWPGVWSLLWALVVAAMFEVLISLVFISPRPKFRFSWGPAKIILHNAKALTVQAALSYIVENADDLIIGKSLGTYTLGVYHNGYALTHKLIYDTAKSASYGLFPVYSKLKDDPKRLRRAVLLSSVGIIAVLIAVAFALQTFAKPIILLALGDKWLAIVPSLGILAFAALLQAIYSLSSVFLYATKKYRPITLSLSIQTIILIVGVWYGSQQFGLVGAAWGIVIARLLSLPQLIWSVAASIDMKPNRHNAT